MLGRSAQAPCSWIHLQSNISPELSFCSGLSFSAHPIKKKPNARSIRSNFKATVFFLRFPRSLHCPSSHLFIKQSSSTTMSLPALPSIQGFNPLKSIPLHGIKSIVWSWGTFPRVPSTGLTLACLSCQRKLTYQTPKLPSATKPMLTKPSTPGECPGLRPCPKRVQSLQLSHTQKDI